MTMISRRNKKPPEDAGGEILDTLEEFMEESGIEAFSNSTIEADYLQFPAFLSEEPSKELGNYLHAFTQQRMYIRGLLHRMEAVLAEAEIKLSPHKDAVFSEQPVKMSVAEKTNKLYSDPRTAKRMHGIFELEQKVALLRSMMQSLDDGIFNISREVTRREGDFSGENRVSNVQNKRRR